MDAARSALQQFSNKSSSHHCGLGTYDDAQAQAIDIEDDAMVGELRVATVENGRRMQYRLGDGVYKERPPQDSVAAG